MLEWQEIAVPQHLGMACDTYKWLQNQTYVELHALIQKCPTHKVSRMSECCVHLTAFPMIVSKEYWSYRTLHPVFLS